MSQLVRMVYVSRSNNPISDAGAGVPRDIGRILMQSRKRNPQREIGGVLYFRDDMFFQCLEGERDEVESLYALIAEDPRHRDVRKILVRDVEDRMFGDWSMKYVALDERVDRLLKENGFASFEPHAFDEAMTEAMLGLFVSARDTTEQSDENDGKGDGGGSRPGLLSRLFGRRKTAS